MSETKKLNPGEFSPARAEAEAIKQKAAVKATVEKNVDKLKSLKEKVMSLHEVGILPIDISKQLKTSLKNVRWYIWNANRPVKKSI